MTYVALLRGINVGGNNKIDMKRLKAAFEEAGMQSVVTYINTGNVVFRNDKLTPPELVTLLEATIEQAFGFAIKVLLCDLPTMQAVVAALPDSWQNNDTMKCDVMFLWHEANNPEVVSQLAVNPAVDTITYVPGALLWCVQRENLSTSGMQKLVGTKLYKQMTIRNCNTTRKLLELMESADA